MSSGQRCNQRERQAISYKTLNIKGFAGDDEGELCYSDSSNHLELETDPQGEKELCRDFSNDEESAEGEFEEGEIKSEDGDEEGEDEEVQRLIEQGNLAQLKKILKRRGEENVRLQKELNREKERENKEMQAIIKKLQVAQKTKTSLKKSIASSRSSSKQSSPNNTPTRNPDRRQDTRQVQRKHSRNKRELEEEKRGEYQDTLASFLKLKHNEKDDFSDKVMNAMDATDRIFSVKKVREKAGERSAINNKVGQQHNSKIDRCEREDSSDDATHTIESLIREVNNTKKRKQDRPIDALIEAMQKITIKDDNDTSEKLTTEQTEKLLSHLTSKENKSTPADRVVKALTALESSVSENEYKDKEDNTEASRKGKLTNGKCTKPDKSDIKRVVKFAHEKLDSRHIKERSFDRLPFNLLVAGEVELIMQPDITEEECRA